MDLKQLEYIVEIAKENNITRAASALFLSQSALNQQLLKLEKELGTPLFFRSPRNWRLTPAGELYVARAKEILQLKKQTYEEIADVAKLEKSRLRIGFTNDRGAALFTAVYPAFHAQYPKVQAEPIECCVREQVERLHAGDLDIGLTTQTESQKSAGLCYRHLSNEEFFLAVPAAEGPSTAVPVALSSYYNRPFVLTGRHTTSRQIVDALFEEAGFAPEILFETANHSTIAAIIRSGLCLGICPAFYTRTLKEGICYLPFDSHPAWELTAVTRKGHYLGEAGEAFIRLIHEKTSREA